MDLEYLLRNAGRFAYEYSKFFVDDEKLLKYFKTEQEVVIISTKKLCIFYCGIIIDYKQGLLKDVELVDVDPETLSFSVILERKEFNIVFQSEKEFKVFTHYFEKYKE